MRNAICEPWSNGQTEGQINRLKMLKRTMYGRASVALLRARMHPLNEIGSPNASQTRSIPEFFAASESSPPRLAWCRTGGKVKLGPISRRGNGYLRRSLVNGATSVLNSKWGKQDPLLRNRPDGHDAPGELPGRSRRRPERHTAGCPGGLRG